jgi:hypothetical protein
MLQLPFDGVDISWDKKFTYLDTQGRPVLVLRKSNVVPGVSRMHVGLSLLSLLSIDDQGLYTHMLHCDYGAGAAQEQCHARCVLHACNAGAAQPTKHE